MFVFTFTTTLFNVSVKENICLYFDDKQSNIYYQSERGYLKQFSIFVAEFRK